MNFIKRSNATYLLIFNAFLWGSSYVLNKMLLQYLPRFTILFLFSLGGLIATAIIFRNSIRHIDKKTIMKGMVVSGFSILSNTFCMLSLQHNDSSVTAFIVQTSVIITPLLMAVMEKKKPDQKMVFNALIALSGLFLITVRFDEFKFNFSILYALGNALFFSLFLTGQKLSSNSVDPKQFTIVHYTTNTLAFLGPALLESRSQSFNIIGFPVLPLLAACMFIAVFTIIIQTGAILYVEPEKAVLLYTLEPVTALVVATLFIGEQPDGIKTIAGCVLILMSVITSVVSPKLRKPRVAKELKQDDKAAQQQAY